MKQNNTVKEKPIELPVEAPTSPDKGIGGSEGGRT